jgi:hypothetical protein
LRTDDAGGFVVEGTFTRGVPNVPAITRMWIDSLGRLDLVWDEKNLAIGFPQGYIPREARTLIPAAALDEMTAP